MIYLRRPFAADGGSWSVGLAGGGVEGLKEKKRKEGVRGGWGKPEIRRRRRGILPGNPPPGQYPTLSIPVFGSDQRRGSNQATCSIYIHFVFYGGSRLGVVQFLIAFQAARQKNELTYFIYSIYCSQFSIFPRALPPGISAPRWGPSPRNFASPRLSPKSFQRLSTPTPNRN